MASWSIPKGWSLSSHRRLLHDIAEFDEDPYPNIHLHVHDADLTRTCLILTPTMERVHNEPLHLTIQIPRDYPLVPPKVTNQSLIAHPNVFGDFICATMLTTDDGWTPAYTLRAVAIQLQSFFSSRFLENEYGEVEDLRAWRESLLRSLTPEQIKAKRHTCDRCGFGPDWPPEATVPTGSSRTDFAQTAARATAVVQGAAQQSDLNTPLLRLPNELMLLLFDKLSTQDIISLCKTCRAVSNLVASSDFVRIRELQCFVLKKSFMDELLGIGISLDNARGRRPVLRSEFELISKTAFTDLRVRKSIHHLDFQFWLPLPLSRRHWNRVRCETDASLDHIRQHAGISGPYNVDIIYSLMNNIVVQFNNTSERYSASTRPDAHSTLTHASEKAVEAYFALFHLLLCMAVDSDAIVRAANRSVAAFIAGPRTKDRFPDLGQFLVKALTSDAGLTEELILLVIEETMIRNVVWMLDAKGAGIAGLAYLEPSPVSEYRLARSFEANKTSYRLQMFIKLFASAARPQGKTRTELRDDMFNTHGAPPAGTCSTMANRIRQLHQVNSFGAFWTFMGCPFVPTKQDITRRLREAVVKSEQVGYSTMPVSQQAAYLMRRVVEPDVELHPDVRIGQHDRAPTRIGSFFPGRANMGGGFRGGHGGYPDRRGGRGGLRGRGGS